MQAQRELLPLPGGAAFGEADGRTPCKRTCTMVTALW